jgi:hypothetical protein
MSFCAMVPGWVSPNTVHLEFDRPRAGR